MAEEQDGQNPYVAHVTSNSQTSKTKPNMSKFVVSKNVPILSVNL